MRLSACDIHYIMHNACMQVLDSLYYLVRNHHRDRMYFACYVHVTRRDRDMISRSPICMMRRSRSCLVEIVWVYNVIMIICIHLDEILYAMHSVSTRSHSSIYVLLLFYVTLCVYLDEISRRDLIYNCPTQILYHKTLRKSTSHDGRVQPESREFPRS